jgi:hypothetical protein
MPAPIFYVQQETEMENGNDDLVVAPYEMKPALQRMNKDLVQAARTMTDDEARYLVDTYYIMQESRKRSDNQLRSMTDEPHVTLAWASEQSTALENQIKQALDYYSDSHEVGRWMKSIYGIGPVIAAGLMAHIDIDKAITAGCIWRFAGIDPTRKWEKKTKRPWNASLKTLTWKIGQSFMKFSGSEKCTYGHLYKKRKEYEVARNERGDNAALAARILTEKNFDKKTDAYKHLSGGKLPPAQIDARARRWAVKLFLSHLQMVWWYMKNNKLPVKPYILDHDVVNHTQHVHMIVPPNMPAGMAEALAART